MVLFLMAILMVIHDFIYLYISDHIIILRNNNEHSFELYITHLYFITILCILYCTLVKILMFLFSFMINMHKVIIKSQSA